MFSNQPSNSGRQYALDYAKALAVACMVICHTIMYMSSGYSNETMFFFADEVLGGPTVAPLFMVCLGVGICYSKRTTPIYLFKRGLILLGGGYLLNVARGGALAIVAGLLLGWSPEENGLGLDLAELSFFSNMIVDILQFAGMAFLFFSLALKIKMSNWILAICAVLFHIIGHCCEGLDLGNAYLTALAGLIFPTGPKADADCVACFPFLLWAIYPIVGYLFGQLLLRLCNLNRFYSYCLIASGIISATYILLICILGPHPFSDGYYWHTLPNAFFYLVLDLFVVSVFHHVGPKLPDSACRYLRYLSRNVTRIYCVSWCLIIWISQLYKLSIDENGIPSIYSYIVGFMILVASCFVEKYSRDKGRF